MVKQKDHSKHGKKRLYARDQVSGAKHWSSTNLFLCSCGAVLELKFRDKKTLKFGGKQ